MTNTLSATTARDNFSEILNRVQFAGEEFIIQKQGKPTAIITSYKVEKQKKNNTPNWAVSMLSLSKRAGKSGVGDLATKHDKYLY